MSSLKLLAIGCAALAACAAHATQSETPRCAGVVPNLSPLPDTEPSVAGANPISDSAHPLPDVDRALLRDWLAPVMSLDTSACPRELSPDYFACWCRLVCGVHLRPREAKVSVSWPHNEAGGPGFAVAPGGTVEECWHTGAAEMAETRVRCAAPR